MNFTIEKVSPSNIDLELLSFFRIAAENVADQYGNKFDWKNFRINAYSRNHRLVVCRHKEKPIGLSLSRLYPSIFDEKVMILYQDLLYGKPGTRAAYLLLKDFIDFGKLNANHVITAIAEKTNIKRGSLERLGFKKLEELYRMEISE